MINKKGMSVIVGSMILILLVIVTSLVVWGIVGNLVDEELGDVESCFGIFDQVNLNDRYTCYDAANNYVQISIALGDISVDGVIIQIEGEGTTKSFTLTNEGQTIGALGDYISLDFGLDSIFLPSENSGKTYVYDASGVFSTTPDIIKIIPIINEKQCEMSDSLSQIDSCTSLI